MLGGSKVSDKLAVIESRPPKVDRLLVGRGCASPSWPRRGTASATRCSRPIRSQLPTVPRRVGRQYPAAPTHIVVAEKSVTDDATGHRLVTSSCSGGRGLDIVPERAGVRGGARRRPDGVLEPADGVSRWRRSPRAPAGSPRQCRRQGPLGGRRRRLGGGGPRWGCDVNAFGHIPPPAAARRWSSSRARPAGCRRSGKVRGG